MKKISSTSNKYFAIAGGVVGVIGASVAIFVQLAHGRKIEPALVIFPIFMLCVVSLVFYLIFRGLVDEVWDDGDALVIKDKGREVRVPLYEIINVGHSQMTNPPRVTLTLRNPTPLGREITFVPERSYTWGFFGKNKVIDELVHRVDAARRGKGG
jgi:hypothetical protein